jgi:hypothetical protein
LSDICSTSGGGSAIFHPCDGGEENSGQDDDNREDDENFDERKARMANSGFFHEFDLPAKVLFKRTDTARRKWDFADE